MAGRDKHSPQDFVAKEHIVNNLKYLQKKNGYRQKEIVEETGIAQGTVSNYFSGKRLPTEDNLQKLADFFQVAIEDIDPRYRPNIILGDNAGSYNATGDNSGTITINNGENYPNTKNNITQLDMLAVLGEILKTDQKILESNQEILKVNEAILNHLTETDDKTKNASQSRGVNPVKK